MLEFAIPLQKLTREAEEEQGGWFRIGELVADPSVDAQRGTSGRTQRFILIGFGKYDITLQHIDDFVKRISPFCHPKSRPVDTFREGDPIGGKGNGNRS